MFAISVLVSSLTAEITYALINYILSAWAEHGSEYMLNIYYSLKIFMVCVCVLEASTPVVRVDGRSLYLLYCLTGSRYIFFNE